MDVLGINFPNPLPQQGVVKKGEKGPDKYYLYTLWFSVN